MEALKTEHFLSQCCGDKGKQPRQVVEFMNRACLSAEQLMNITQTILEGKMGIDCYTVQQSFMVYLYKDKNRRCLKGSLFLRRSWKTFPHSSSKVEEKKKEGKKSDLSFNGQLMMSYHYTQILWSPSKPAPLRADWLAGWERGRVFFLSFPLASGLIPVPQ